MAGCDSRTVEVPRGLGTAQLSSRLPFMTGMCRFGARPIPVNHTQRSPLRDSIDQRPCVVVAMFQERSQHLASEFIATAFADRQVDVGLVCHRCRRGGDVPASYSGRGFRAGQLRKIPRGPNRTAS